MSGSELGDPGDRLIPLGRIARAHGVQGAVAVSLYNPENPQGLLTAPQVFLLTPSEPPRPVTLNGRAVSSGLIVKIKGFTTRNAAETLKNLELAVFRRDLPELEEEEYYQADLLGLTACLEDGQALGQVVDFIATGGGLVLVIKNERGQESLVPFCEEMVPKVELAAGRLWVTNRPGLLELPEKS
ncbi:MAG: ribosome maturation factor RimM [Deltaproteobacteria bacterium]|nr:ribosome maturation factor RimM [Deltaproteobacteria bacterium]